MNTDIVADIRRAPYASLSEEEVEILVRLLPHNPPAVAEALYREAAIHAMADNWIKSDVVANLADRIM